MICCKMKEKKRLADARGDSFPKQSNDHDYDEMKGYRVNRTPKRVQSQLITSGKQAERSAKRKRGIIAAV